MNPDCRHSTRKVLRRRHERHGLTFGTVHCLGCTGRALGVLYDDPDGTACIRTMSAFRLGNDSWPDGLSWASERERDAALEDAAARFRVPRCDRCGGPGPLTRAEWPYRTESDLCATCLSAPPRPGDYPPERPEPLEGEYWA